MEKNRPDLFFLELSVLLISHLNLIFKSVINVLKDKYYFVES
jgi:hypothetical protein